MLLRALAGCLGAIVGVIGRRRANQQSCRSESSIRPPSLPTAPCATPRDLFAALLNYSGVINPDAAALLPLATLTAVNRPPPARGNWELEQLAKHKSKKLLAKDLAVQEHFNRDRRLGHPSTREVKRYDKGQNRDQQRSTGPDDAVVSIPALHNPLPRPRAHLATSRVTLTSFRWGTPAGASYAGKGREMGKGWAPRGCL